VEKMAFKNTNANASNNPVAVLTQVITRGAPLVLELFTHIYPPEEHKEDTEDLYSEYLDDMIADWKRKEDEGKTIHEAEINEEKNPVLQANDDLKLAIEHLKRAKENNPCRVCKPRIEDAKKYVEDKTKEIIRAGEIDKKMKELQSTGELAKKPWRELTKEEKDFVRGTVDSR
jgi:N12 class adenine-specific DNA methylase